MVGVNSRTRLRFDIDVQFFSRGITDWKPVPLRQSTLEIKSPGCFTTSRGLNSTKSELSTKHFLQFVNETFCHWMIDVLA